VRAEGPSPAVHAEKCEQTDLLQSVAKRAVCHTKNDLNLKVRTQQVEGKHYIKKNFINVSFHKPAT
jgi:hypothetical protein